MSARDFLDGKVRLHPGDCLDVIRTLPDNSIDAVCTDPPYALVSIVKRYGGKDAAPATADVYARASAGFMGKQWDTGERAFAVEFWAEVLRVLKPGGHVAAFSGTRTYHRLACAIEDAGFEIRDQLAWAYGSGFPKSHDVSKGIDRVRDWSKVESLNTEIKRARLAAGMSLRDIGDAMQEATGGQYGTWYHRGGHMFFETGRSLPSRPEWEHLRQVLPIDPAYHDTYDEAEREVVGTKSAARSESGSWAANIAGGMFKPGDRDYEVTAPATDTARQWQGWGTALKPAWEPICLARKPLIGTIAANVLAHGTGALNIDGCRIEGVVPSTVRGGHGEKYRVNDSHADAKNLGRLKPQGFVEGNALGRWPANLLHDGSAEVVECFPEGRSAGNHPSGSEGTGNGVTYLATKPQGTLYADSGSAARFFYTAKADADDRLGSKHPTVKPVDLMQWLCRLITPPGGLILDPFAGTGTTGEAAFREGFRAVLIEREAEYQADIAKRMSLVLAGPDERKRARTKPESADALPLFGGVA